MAGNLQKNLDEVQSKIAKAQSENPQVMDPTIVAVSKKQPVDKIRELYELGIAEFGENYLQEALPKIQSLQKLKITWHFIGQLQTKKIKDIVGNFDLIHSVFRDEEIQKISQVALEKSIEQKVLMQINIADEKTKGGLSPSAADFFCEKVRGIEGVELCGMMVFPPLEESEEATCKWFDKSKKLFDELKPVAGSEWKILSMGTSQDFHLALPYGATHLRIGERLMGERPN